MNGPKVEEIKIKIDMSKKQIMTITLPDGITPVEAIIIMNSTQVSLLKGLEMEPAKKIIHPAKKIIT